MLKSILPFHIITSYFTAFSLLNSESIAVNKTIYIQDKINVELIHTIALGKMRAEDVWVPWWREMSTLGRLAMDMCFELCPVETIIVNQNDLNKTFIYETNSTHWTVSKSSWNILHYWDTKWKIRDLVLIFSTEKLSLLGSSNCRWEGLAWESP